MGASEADIIPDAQGDAPFKQEGLLRIRYSYKKVRDDRGYWSQTEA